MWGGYVRWEAGSSSEDQELTQLLDAEHWPLVDVIGIVSKDEKKVPSSKAHLDAWSSPLFKPRLAGLEEKEEQMIEAIRNKDLWCLGPLLEQEALEMHGVMMTAEPPTRYLSPVSCEFIVWLRQIRRQQGLSAFFTIDAGPNIHVICEKDSEGRLVEEVKKAFPQLDLLIDQVGTGPSLRQVTG